MLPQISSFLVIAFLSTFSSLFSDLALAFSSSSSFSSSSKQRVFFPQPIFSHPRPFVQRTVMASRPSTEQGLSLLQQRLEKAGAKIDQMEMVIDEDWARLLLDGLGDSDDGDCSKEGEEKNEASSKGSSSSSDESTTAIEIKTLVWEVSCNHHEHATATAELVDKFYIVTALRMDDKVELSLLLDLVYNNIELPFGCTPGRLSMAPQSIAEALTGFESGCMPPIGHTTPMKLFIDGSIMSNDSAPESSSSSSSSSMTTTRSATTTASIGAGVLGKSLLLPLDEFLRIAHNSEKGANVGYFIQRKTLTTTSRSASPSPSSSRSVGTLSSSRNNNGENENELTPMEIRQQRKMDRLERRPEPKDRLKEYQKFRNIVDKAKLFRTTVRKQGRMEDVRKLIDEAVSTNDFPELFHVSNHEQGMDKNALHVCAWRGDFEAVQLIVETAKSRYPGLDIVNMISRGGGNYGKTPIFFALTQCREDVVRYLVSQGANLLIVNNKGQTPCSIAVSHLKEDACSFLFEVEAQQLKAGGSFTNYRETNSDGKFYGDLDPRFLIDNANQGDDDVSAQVRQYEQSVFDAPKDTIYNGVPSQFEPRSLRPTIRWWVREARSLKEANQAGRSGTQLTFTQPRPLSPKKNKESSSRVLRPSLMKLDLPSITTSVESLPRLLISDVLEGAREMIVVDDTETISLLEAEADACLAYLSDLSRNTGKTHDEILVNSTWGIDAEWKPGVGCGVDNPVSTLQLSTRRKAFLVDLQSICQDFRTRPKVVNELESRLDVVLSKIFSSQELPLLGYGVLQDLGKLAASFAHLKCFSEYNSVIDLQTVSSVVHPKSSRQSMSSLQRISAQLLGKHLDKTQQCSDWTIRPLSQEQIDYAILDAAVLPILLSTMVKSSSVVGRYNGQFFKIHGHLQSAVRYTKVDPTNDSHTYDVPMGAVKLALGQQMARQCWPSTQEKPEPPKLVPFDLAETPCVTKKERGHLQKVGVKTGTKRPKAVQLKILAGNLENLPLPGITLGYTKESCVFRVVGHELLNTFPEGTYVGFNRRAGVVETTNAWIVFCNFGARAGGGLPIYGKSFSEFYNGGRHLSFRLNPKAQSGSSSEATLYRYLMSTKEQMKNQKQLVLFARDGTRSKYLYCGRCSCVKIAPLDSGATSVLFELLEFETLTGKAKISSEFQDLVEQRHENLQEVC